jgi:hypothetical protein
MCSMLLLAIAEVTHQTSDVAAQDAPPAAATVLTDAELRLNGASSQPTNLFKVGGRIGVCEATLMIDSGASSEFIDTDFARRCGLKLAPSSRTIRLADGSAAPVDGEVTVAVKLYAPKDRPAVQFTATFTATRLPGHDAILGVSWLTAHDVGIGWSNRTIEIRSPGEPPRVIRPQHSSGEPPSSNGRIAVLSAKGLGRASRRGEVDEIFALFVKPKGEDASLPAAAAAEHPQMAALLKEYADVFPDALPKGLPPLRGVEHRILLKPGSVPPIARPLRHQSTKDLAVFEEYTRSMIEAGQLRVSKSPYGAMALIVRKKDGSSRVVVDYRALNEMTVKNKYPLPLMDELFDRVVNAKYFSKLDLRTGFHQIRVHDDDVEKTAFRTRYGSFEYRVLPMGLCNAPGSFMQLMNETFREQLDKTVLVFLDDILVYSETLDDHVKHVREVLERLRTAKLYAKLSKCEFFRAEVEFLGHHIGANGLSVMQDKIASVRDWPTPQNVTDVRSFLGLAGFYRRFVKGFSDVALPITELTKTVTGAPFLWGPRQAAAFAALKGALCSAPVLLIADPKLPYTLNCDACQYAIGATLQQDHGNGLQPVAYMSRKLTPAEINYDTRDKECLALVDACSHWRQYLHSDIPFTLLTDHDSLKYIKSMQHLSGRFARWMERMAEFNYEIAHIAGVKNVVADALSRRADLKDDPETLAAASLRPRGPDLAAAAAANRIRDRAAAELVVPTAADRPEPNTAGVIKMPSHVCTANTRAGQPCRMRTAMGQYCWNHLRTACGLRIRKSDVPGGGMGLHAARDLPIDFRIDYTGDRIALTERNGGEYVLELTHATGIDAARTNSGEGRWMNDPRGTGHTANCEFRVYTPRGQPRIGCLRTTRPVKMGEELFVRYGADYWRLSNLAARKNSRRKLVLPVADLAVVHVDPELADAIVAAAAAHAA